MFDVRNVVRQRPTSEATVRFLLLLVDVAAIAGACAGAYLLRYNTGLAEHVAAPPLDFVLVTSLLLGGSALMCLRAMGTARVRQVWRPLELACSALLAAVIAATFFAALSLVGARFFHRLFAVYFVVLLVPLLLAARYAVYRVM